MRVIRERERVRQGALERGEERGERGEERGERREGRGERGEGGRGEQGVTAVVRK